MNKLFYSILAASALAVLPAQAAFLATPPSDNLADVSFTTASGTYYADFYGGIITDPANDDGGNPNRGKTYLDANESSYGTWTNIGNISGSVETATGTYTAAGINTIQTNADGKQFAVSLKASTGWSYYIFTGLDASDIISGNWDSLSGTGKDSLSHSSLYVSTANVTGGSTGGTTGGSTGGTTGGSTGGTTGGPQVPEPSTYAMFGMAFGMFAFLRYRSRKS